MWHTWERREKCARFLWESPKPRDNSEDQGIDGRVGSDWILGRLAGGCRVDPVGSGYRPLVGFCNYSDRPLGSGATELVS
jgi:hypothetical protein